MQVLGLDRS